MGHSPPKPLIRKIDCVRLYVPDLQAALALCRDRPGQALIWRTPHAAGLRLPQTDAEIVLQSEGPGSVTGNVPHQGEVRADGQDL